MVMYRTLTLLFLVFSLLVGPTSAMTGAAFHACHSSESYDCPQGSCTQVCQGQSCAFTCGGGSCRQLCRGGNCIFSCRGGNCLQTCQGGRCNFSCEGRLCTHTCKGGACSLFCPSGGCDQACQGGACKLSCSGGMCKKNCGGGSCQLRRTDEDVCNETTCTHATFRSPPASHRWLFWNSVSLTSTGNSAMEKSPFMLTYSSNSSVNEQPRMTGEIISLVVVVVVFLFWALLGYYYRKGSRWNRDLKVPNWALPLFILLAPLLIPPIMGADAVYSNSEDPTSDNEAEPSDNAEKNRTCSCSWAIDFLRFFGNVVFILIFLLSLPILATGVVSISLGADLSHSRWLLGMIPSSVLAWLIGVLLPLFGVFLATSLARLAFSFIFNELKSINLWSYYGLLFVWSALTFFAALVAVFAFGRVSNNLDACGFVTLLLSTLLIDVFIFTNADHSGCERLSAEDYKRFVSSEVVIKSAAIIDLPLRAAVAVSLQALPLLSHTCLLLELSLKSYIVCTQLEPIANVLELFYHLSSVFELYGPNHLPHGKFQIPNLVDVRNRWLNLRLYEPDARRNRSVAKRISSLTLSKAEQTHFIWFLQGVISYPALLRGLAIRFLNELEENRRAIENDQERERFGHEFGYLYACLALLCRTTLTAVNEIRILEMRLRKLLDYSESGPTLMFLIDLGNEVDASARHPSLAVWAVCDTFKLFDEDLSHQRGIKRSIGVPVACRPNTTVFELFTFLKAKNVVNDKLLLKRKYSIFGNAAHSICKTPNGGSSKMDCQTFCDVAAFGLGGNEEDASTPLVSYSQMLVVEREIIISCGIMALLSSSVITFSAGQQFVDHGKSSHDLSFDPVALFDGFDFEAFACETWRIGHVVLAILIIQTVVYQLLAIVLRKRTVALAADAFFAATRAWLFVEAVLISYLFWGLPLLRYVFRVLGPIREEVLAFFTAIFLSLVLYSAPSRIVYLRNLIPMGDSRSWLVPVFSEWLPQFFRGAFLYAFFWMIYFSVAILNPTATSECGVGFVHDAE